MNLITNYVTHDDIDLVDKLNNMYESEISEEIYEKCLQKDVFRKIENKVWELINDKNSQFAYTSLYESLAREYEPTDEHDLWSARLYNCDLLYMTAIAHVLGLAIPNDSCDIHIFGM